MKRRDLEKALRDAGWWKLPPGAKHDAWTNGEMKEPVPRHAEINEYTAKAILKRVRANPPKDKKA